MSDHTTPTGPPAPEPAAPHAATPHAAAPHVSAPPITAPPSDPPGSPAPLLSEVQPSEARPSKARRRAGAVALVAAGLIAGGVLTSAISATADSDAGSGSSTEAPSDTTRPPRPDGAVDESHSLRPDEELLTGDVAAAVEAAALAEYPGATILRVETDSDGVYEAHLVTADGERVTVEMGEDYVITGEEAMGAGGPGGRGPGGRMPEDGRVAPEGGLSTPDDGATPGAADDGLATPSSTT